MQWKPEYSLGIEEIDAQHQELIAKFSEVERLIAARVDWNTIHLSLKELSQLASGHFGFEEGLMRLFGIPNSDKHKKDHAVFFTKMAEIEQAVLQTSAEKSLLRFLDEWILNHMLLADRQDFGEYVAGIAQVVKSAATTPSNVLPLRMKKR